MIGRKDMRFFLKYFPVLMAAAAFAGICPAHAQNPHAQPGRIDMDGLFLEQLQPRDSVLIADQLEYGFVLDGVREGTGFAFPDFSKGFRDSVDLVSGWKIDTLDIRGGRKGNLL